MKPSDADITSVASTDVPQYRQECDNEKQTRCWQNALGTMGGRKVS